jgi:hypothetical protein
MGDRNEAHEVCHAAGTTTCESRSVLANPKADELFAFIAETINAGQSMIQDVVKAVGDVSHGLHSAAVLAEQAVGGHRGGQGR